MPRQKKIYLRSEEIYREWLVWKNEGRITERLALQLQSIAQNMIRKDNFKGYSKEQKEDMVQDAVLKMLKNLKNVDEEKKDALFNYMTRCAWCSFMASLNRYYRDLNTKRNAAEEAQSLYEARFGHAPGIDLSQDPERMNLRRYSEEEQE